MGELQKDPIVGEIIAAAIEVHRQLGPGLLESTYQFCLAWELASRGIPFLVQAPMPLTYKNERLDCGYRVDLLVDTDVIVEIKSVEALKPIHDAQVMTYLRLSGARHALLINFNCTTLKAGLRSFVGYGKRVPPDI